MNFRWWYCSELQVVIGGDTAVNFRWWYCNELQVVILQLVFLHWCSLWMAGAGPFVPHRHGVPSIEPEHWAVQQPATEARPHPLHPHLGADWQQVPTHRAWRPAHLPQWYDRNHDRRRSSQDVWTTGEIQTRKRLKRMLFISPKHNMQIFGIITFVKLQNHTLNNSSAVKNEM